MSHADVRDPAEMVFHALSRDDIHTADDIREEVTALIRDGRLPEGARLPTIRDLTHGSHLSSRAIVGAWAELRRAGLIDTNRRGGTVVAGPADGAERNRGWADRDLLTGSPDYSLQPDLAPAILAGLRTDQLNRPRRDYITDRLRDAVQRDWPFAAESYVAAGGGSEGLLLAVEAAASPGDLVAVEEPIIPGFLDTLEAVGYRVVGIESDDHGARPESLAAALALGPTVVVLQPEGAYAAGGVLDKERADALADVIENAGHTPWIVEDDAVGPLAVAQAPSLGDRLPHRTVRVRSYCKAFGMDIKTCVIGGAATVVDQAIRLRVHGIAANSRILQNALAHLVADPSAAEVVASAREHYDRRRTALVSALADRGITASSGPNSLVVWAEVRDETGAMLELARRGVNVGSGARSFVGSGTGLLRIAVPQLPDDVSAIGDLADQIAAAASAVHREFLD
ncbi:aminotransferase class I/II-fold pyridoxal phosphate-dependent enzyme [Williamsia deligens]|uniref:Aminotransferase class I/II-fold pyridoxal phosphate-dependent enzyme n=1 Tax=Williamsia deligens TaxID=321325 RepID=A0ABW3G838_9NOCA|nr:aminotransferase class I/II-fold pyridoxal phosphate-dependent enzyme [Williamsia deligens]